MPLNYSIAWVTIAAHNFETIVDFYTQLLGRAPDRRLGPADALSYAEFHLQGLRLGIYRPTAETSVASASGPMSICFQVENLEAAIDHLTAIGYPPDGKILTPSHGREIYAFDPEGNRLILYQAKELRIEN